MKKGFTLIELLAVIVILAIIALIATPIVLNIINDTKESAQLRSAEMYLRGVEQAIIRENMDRVFNPVSCKINENGNLECDGNTEPITVDVDGEKPIDGNISFEEGKISKSIVAYKNNIAFQKNKDGEFKDAKFCKLEVGEALTRGAKYTCDPGDGEKRTFYLLEYDDSTGEAQLIMNENLKDASMWEPENSPDENGPDDPPMGPFKAIDSLNEQTKTWENVAVDLPTEDQVDSVSTSSNTDLFLIENLINISSTGQGPTIETSYWTKDVDCDTRDCWNDLGSYSALAVSGDRYDPEFGGYIDGGVEGASSIYISCEIGIRPVITISKYNL